MTGFDYDNFDDIVEFYDVAIERLLEVVGDEIFIFTAIKRDGRDVVNQAIVIHNHKIVYTQNKYKLFRDEKRYLKAGREEDFLHFSINGVKLDLLSALSLDLRSSGRG